MFTLPSHACFCAAPLLDVLRLYTRINSSHSPLVLMRLWSHITGVALSNDSTSLSPYKQHVPLLLKDVVAQLLQLMLMLPLSMELGMELTVA